MMDNQDTKVTPANTELHEVTILRRKNDALEQKLIRAQGIIDDLKADIPKANKQAINTLNRKLQPTRDRLVAISSTTRVILDQTPHVNENTATKIALYNILESVSIIAAELEQLGLWEHDNVKPKGIQDMQESGR